MSNRTLVLLKPDAVERQLVGGILSRFETKGLKLVAIELRTLDAAILERHYEEHKGKPFYDGLVSFMTSGPITVIVLEKHQAIADWRKLLGPTNTEKVLPRPSHPVPPALQRSYICRPKPKIPPVFAPSTAPMAHRMHATAPIPPRRPPAKFPYFSPTSRLRPRT